MTVESSTILLEKADHIATIRINRPQKRNAINKEMFNRIRSIATKLNEDSNIWIVVIRGVESNGRQIFSAGIDVIELAPMVNSTQDEVKRLGEELQASFNSIEELNKPVICLIEGYCLGAGLELALACDLRIATEDSILGYPEVELGIIPDLGGTTRMVRTVGINHTKRMILTADNINGTEALDMGLVNYVVSSGKAQVKLDSVVNKLLKNSPVALSKGKKLINKVFNLDLKTALKTELETQMELLRSDDVKEAFVSKIEKRDPQWTNK